MYSRRVSRARMSIADLRAGPLRSGARRSPLIPCILPVASRLRNGWFLRVGRELSLRRPAAAAGGGGPAADSLGHVPLGRARAVAAPRSIRDARDRAGAAAAGARRVGPRPLREAPPPRRGS